MRGWEILGDEGPTEWCSWWKLRSFDYITHTHVFVGFSSLSLETLEPPCPTIICEKVWTKVDIRKLVVNNVKFLFGLLKTFKMQILSKLISFLSELSGAYLYSSTVLCLGGILASWHALSREDWLDSQWVREGTWFFRWPTLPFISHSNQVSAAPPSPPHCFSTFE